MHQSIKIAQSVLNRLNGVPADTIQTGKLYGIVVQNTLTVLSIELNLALCDLSWSFPAEIDLCGFLAIGIENNVPKDLSHIDITDNPVYIHYNPQTQDVCTYSFINEKMEKVPFSAVNDVDLTSEYLYVRIRCTLPLSCELTKSGLREAFQKARSNLASGLLVFQLPHSNALLMSSDHGGLIDVTGEPSMSDVWHTYTQQAPPRSAKSCQHINVLNVSVLKKNASVEHAPLCILLKKTAKVIRTSIPIDALALLYRQTKLSNLYDILVESANRNLRLVEKACISNVDGNIEPEIYHFYPDGMSHFLSRVYMKTTPDTELLEERRGVHKTLLLDETKPQLRRANMYMPFKNATTRRLLNPHEGVKPPQNHGTIGTLKGKYEYYHYGQDDLDDKGWGCAYRSLQTLASWYKIQGFLKDEDTVPTFTEIQECLVRIGDKPSTFINSKQWIGSMEVQFVLNTLYGIESRIIYVQSGADLADKGPELLYHFERTGTPIMIGGGMLAHTILGVSYNHENGKTMFLILDPHYTGSEDYDIVQNKGWCGWKNADFWNKASYYNMCLPQVPKVV